MKKNLLLLLLMAGPFVAGSAAEEKVMIASDKVAIKELKDTLSKEELPLVKVEKKAHFPGGSKKMVEYLRDNLVYPKEAQDKSIEGRVFVRFVVKKDGSITEARISRSVDPLLDAEALRLVNGMPKWVPAQVGEKDVNSLYLLPLTFRLGNSADVEKEVKSE
ncbi:MAG: energy transducer TonB [Paludibacteraceae bacterium]|nr:energy transducer TonB [Paludibacteraceae bacterium]